MLNHLIEFQYIKLFQKKYEIDLNHMTILLFLSDVFK